MTFWTTVPGHDVPASLKCKVTAPPQDESKIKLAVVVVIFAVERFVGAVNCEKPTKPEKIKNKQSINCFIYYALKNANILKVTDIIYLGG